MNSNLAHELIARSFRMKPMSRLIFPLLLSFVGCAESTDFLPRTNQHMPATSGFFSERMLFNGQERNFVLFLPKNYTPEKKYPTILFLHGLNGAGSDGLQQVATGLGRYMADHCNNFPFIVIFPQADRNWFDRFNQDQAIAALEEVQSRYSIDADRIYLCGISLGGYGAFVLGARYPDRFAAITTMSGLSEERVAGKLINVPIWCFHYETDPFVGCHNSERMVHLINAAGGQAKLTKVPGFGHYVWNKVYGDDFFNWLLNQRLHPASHSGESPTARQGGGGGG